MQAQTAISVKNFSNREQLQARIAQSTLFVNVSARYIHLLVADLSQKEVTALVAIQMPKEGILFEQHIEELKNTLSSFEFAHAEFQQTIIIAETPYYTFVPEALFVAEKAESYLKLMHKIPASYTVAHNRSNQRVCVYAMHTNCLNNLKTIFAGATVYHYSQALLDGIFNTINKNTKDTLYVNLHRDYMDVIHISNNALQFMNTFPFEADTDIVYFLLSVAEHQKMDNNKLSVVLSGEVSNSSTLVQMLKKYIPEVAIQPRPASFIYPASFREFQEQQYYTSIVALLCEL